MQAALISMTGILYLLPEDFTKWDSGANKDLSFFEKREANIAKGPVSDEDPFIVNYVGHPLSGAWYYNMAREDGFNPFYSFLYSAFVSTFVWEYGYEAFAEIPSKQDLIITPVLGSIMGEGMYYLASVIRKNDGEVLHSKTLGSISYFLINPLGLMTSSLENSIGYNTEIKYETYQLNSETNEFDRYIINTPDQFSNLYYGASILIKF